MGVSVELLVVPPVVREVVAVVDPVVPVVPVVVVVHVVVVVTVVVDVVVVVFLVPLQNHKGQWNDGIFSSCKLSDFIR